ncbi:MAG TPA: hypothetical protein VLW55_18315 [Burkholderiaceae bacterium]|nr:hypothetical protein [Burkholderiaceae bacterium]
MNSQSFASLILAATLASPVVAQDAQPNEPEHRLGQHPAVIIKELWKKQGYDYVSKFYPHPAWLYLLPEAPGEAKESPPDVAARPERHDVTDASIPAQPPTARR